MTFADRVNMAKQFEEELFSRVKNMGFNVAINGAEHTHPDFVRRLHKSIDQTSLAIRFQPDGIVSIGRLPRCFYLEAKNSKTIEKNAYEQYIKLHNAGNLVVVVFKKLVMQWNFADRIELVDGNTSQARFVNKHPIINKWVTPRRGNVQMIRGSGTPYRYINVNSLIQWGFFKQEVIKRLSQDT